MPQYIVWCLTITLHAPARFLFVAIYYQYYLKELRHHKHYLANLTCGLNIIENISLLGLTYLTSSGAYRKCYNFRISLRNERGYSSNMFSFSEFHEKFFITFMAASELYMLITCYILKYERKSTSGDQLQAYSLKIKTRLLVVNVISFTIAGYFFVRHNKYCEPGSK